VRVGAWVRGGARVGQGLCPGGLAGGSFGGLGRRSSGRLWAGGRPCARGRLWAGGFFGGLVGRFFRGIGCAVGGRFGQAVWAADLDGQLGGGLSGRFGQRIWAGSWGDGQGGWVGGLVRRLFGGLGGRLFWRFGRAVFLGIWSGGLGERFGQAVWAGGLGGRFCLAVLAGGYFGDLGGFFLAVWAENGEARSSVSRDAARTPDFIQCGLFALSSIIILAKLWLIKFAGYVRIQGKSASDRPVSKWPSSRPFVRRETQSGASESHRQQLSGRASSYAPGGKCGR
jgi:hypothetical protein